VSRFVFTCEWCGSDVEVNSSRPRALVICAACAEENDRDSRHVRAEQQRLSGEEWAGRS